MPSKPDKDIMSEQDPSMLNSPGVITRSQLKRLSTVKVDSVKTCLVFENKTDTKNSTPSKCIGVNQHLDEAMPQSVTKGRKRKELSDIVGEGSGRKTRKVQDTVETPIKPEKSKTNNNKKSISSSVKNVKLPELEINQENLNSGKKTARTTRKNNCSNKSGTDKASLVEKLLADMKKDLDRESIADDTSSENSNKMKGVNKDAELNNKGDRGKKAVSENLKSKPEILEPLIPKIEKDSPVKKIELLVPKIKKEESPSKVKEETITHTTARTSIDGDAEEGLSVKPDPQIGTSDNRHTSLPLTGLDDCKHVDSGLRAKEVSDSSDNKQSKVNKNKSLEISKVLYSCAKAEEVGGSSRIKSSKVLNLNKSLEISDVSGSKSREVSDSSDIKQNTVAIVNKSLETFNVDGGSKAREGSDNSDIKEKKVAILNKSVDISISSKDSEKVKIEENYRCPVNSMENAVEEIKNCDVLVADNILKPLVKFSSSAQKVTPWNHSTAQLSWQSIKLVDGTSDSDSDAESRKAIMESAQRRIEQNLSTSESESRFLQRIQPSLSDSDSAPDCVSFQASSRAASESLKNAVQSIQRDKQRRKEKRRARLEMLRIQKEEKLMRLKEKLASQVDASCSSSEESGYEEEALKLYKYDMQPLAKAKASVEKENCVISSELKKSFTSGEVGGDCLLQAGKEVPQNNLKSLPSDVLDKLPEKVYPKEMKADAAISKIKKRKKEEEDSLRDSLKGIPAFKKPSTAADFIPLKGSGATKFGVVALDKMGMAPKPISSLAADFKQNMMFGSRHKREPAKVGIAYQQKLQTSGRNVFARKKF